MEYRKFKIDGTIDYIDVVNPVLNFSGTGLVFRSHNLFLSEDEDKICLDGSYYTNESDSSPIIIRTYEWKISETLSAGQLADGTKSLADNIREASVALFLSLPHHAGAYEII